jgi:hypothetical protein
VVGTDRSYFNSIQVDRCPQQALLHEKCDDIRRSQEEGDNTSVMLDGNKDIREGTLFEVFRSCNLNEVIIQHHGKNTPPT